MWVTKHQHDRCVPLFAHIIASAIPPHTAKVVIIVHIANSLFKQGIQAMHGITRRCVHLSHGFCNVYGRPRSWWCSTTREKCAEFSRKTKNSQKHKTCRVPSGLFSGAFSSLLLTFSRVLVHFDLIAPVFHSNHHGRRTSARCYTPAAKQQAHAGWWIGCCHWGLLVRWMWGRGCGGCGCVGVTCGEDDAHCIVHTVLSSPIPIPSFPPPPGMQPAKTTLTTSVRQPPMPEQLWVGS